MMNPVDRKHLNASEKAKERKILDTRDKLIEKFALIQKEVSAIQTALAEGEQALALGIPNSEQLKEHYIKFSGHLKGLSDIKERLDKIQASLRSDGIKISVFGRTSTGKSAVINALLGERILPSGLGHVTNCFIEIRGTDEKNEFLIEHRVRKDIKRLREKPNAQSAGTKHAAHLEVHWPKTKCQLLENDFVIIDSPGIDVDVELDKGITQYCADSDVFILVVNGEASMSLTETSFLKRIATEISIPNMCILVNRWDLCIEDENIEWLKEQHRNTSQELFESVGKNISNTQNVFFVSAKNTLEKGFDVDDKDGSTNEFNKFKNQLMEFVGTSAVATKCQRHVKSWKEMCEQLANRNEEALQCITHGRTLTKCAQSNNSREIGDIRLALSDVEGNTIKAIESLRSTITSMLMPLAEQIDPRKVVESQKEKKFNGTSEEYIKNLHDCLKNRIFELAQGIYEKEIIENLVTMSKQFIAGTAEYVLRELLVEQTTRIGPTLSLNDVDKDRKCLAFQTDFSFKANKKYCVVAFVVVGAAAGAVTLPFIAIAGIAGVAGMSLGGGVGSVAATIVYQKINWNEQAIIKEDFIENANNDTMRLVVKDFCDSTVDRISKELRDLRDEVNTKLNRAWIDLKQTASMMKETVRKLDSLSQTTEQRRTTIVSMMSGFDASVKTDLNL